MRNLEPRLEKLEQVYSPSEITVITLTNWGEAELRGWKGDNGFHVKRNPGEPEESLAHRAAGEARAYYNAHPSLLPAHIVLQLDREYVPHVKPKPRPEPIPETRAARGAQPAV